MVIHKGDPRTAESLATPGGCSGNAAPILNWPNCWEPKWTIEMLTDHMFKAGTLGSVCGKNL